MSNAFYNKIENIIKYLRDNGVPKEKISAQKNEVMNSGDERVEFNLVSEEKSTAFVEEGLKDFFSGGIDKIEKPSSTEINIITSKEKIYNENGNSLEEKSKKYLDLMIKILKNDSKAFLKIKEYMKVPRKKWYEKGAIMWLLSIFTPILGAITIFLNRFMTSKKKWILGILALLWGAVAYFGLMKLGKLGMNLPKGLFGFWAGIVPIIGAIMIFLNKYIGALKKWVFGLLTLAIGLFSLNSLKNFDFLPKTNLPNVSVEDVKVPDLEEVKDKVETKTHELVRTFEADLKDLISTKNLVVNKISDKEIKLIAHNDITFNTNDATINSEFQTVLNSITKTLKDNPEYKIKIEGYTDNTGTDEVNEKLSLERSEHVANYLKEQGIEAERITTAGMGSKNPVATNDTDEGKKENRRIEMTIFKD